MPCPFFEPRNIAEEPTHRFGFGRLPLIDEYDGVCHLREARPVLDARLRFEACNTGFANSSCSDWNRHLEVLSNRRPVLRFSIQTRQQDILNVTVVEEIGYAPARWRTVTFQAASQTFEPDITEPCERAQLLAFCQSYLQRFPISQS